MSLKFETLCLFLLLLLGKSSIHKAQNSLSLFSSNGKVFRVAKAGKLFYQTFQAHVLIENIKEDTLALELEFENKKKFHVQVFMLEKGLPVSNKEFSYLVDFRDATLNFVFKGISNLSKIPDPIVPKEPVIDTSRKYYNTILGHFCELKEGKPSYYNNVPNNKVCAEAMPKGYMNYLALLMSKAEVQDHKFIIAENVCRNNCLSIEQLKTILVYIDYEIEKLKLVRLAYYHIVDPQNKKELESSFRFESSTKELNNFFKEAENKKPQTNNNCVNPASQMLIDRYIERLSAFSNDSERFESFKKSYADVCYTINQVKQVLSTFIHDREKLDAAKLLYPYCLEKQRFMEVKELFSYNQTTSELNDYVTKQGQ